MGLAIFALIVAIVIVLFFLIALGRISFGASMIIFAILILTCLICLSLFAPIGKIFKVGIILAAVGVGLAAISYYTASGLDWLFWWLNKDTTPVEKEKRKTCPACGAENMLGRLFCVKCGKRLIYPKNTSS